MSTPVHADEFLALTFSPDALISGVSPGVEHWSSYSASELIGRPITHLLADRSVFELPHILECASALGVWEGDVVLTDRSGKDLRTQGSISTLAGCGQFRPGFLLVSTSRGARVLSRDERTALQETGARLRMLSHEMNNPLAVMMGFIQLILLNPQCAGKVRADMETLLSEMDRVVHVVERLHKYALSLQEEPPSDMLDTKAG